MQRKSDTTAAILGGLGLLIIFGIAFGPDDSDDEARVHAAPVTAPTRLPAVSDLQFADTAELTGTQSESLVGTRVHWVGRLHDARPHTFLGKHVIEIDMDGQGRHDLYFYVTEKQALDFWKDCVVTCEGTIAAVSRGRFEIRDVFYYVSEH